MQRMTVGDVMTRGVLSVGPDTSFRDVATTLFAGAVRAVVAPTATVAAAARVMRERRLSWLPVTDVGGRMVGVLGRSDLLAVFLRDDATIRAEIVDGVLVGMLLVDPARVSVEVTDGVVTLAGQLDTRTDAVLASQFVGRLDGVVDVVDRLTRETDAHPSDLDVARLY